MKDINRFVETQTKYPFSMKNIYRMLDILLQTRGQIMDRALEEAFDNITERYKDNRYHLEGWKTNSHYLVNEKFILPYVVEQGWNGEMKFKYNGYATKLDDLHKALVFLTGQHKEESLLSHHTRGDTLTFHEWHDWGFFQIKGFKKGTIHCKFKDPSVWDLFNRRVAKIKGYPLPEHI